MKLAPQQEEKLNSLMNKAKDALEGGFNHSQVYRFYNPEKAMLPLSIIDFLLKTEIVAEEIEMFQLILKQAAIEARKQRENINIGINEVISDVKANKHLLWDDNKTEKALLEDLTSAYEIVRLSEACASFMKASIARDDADEHE